MYCSKCGKEVSDGTKFCPECGGQIGSNGCGSRSANYVTTIIGDLSTVFWRRKAAIGSGFVQMIVFAILSVISLILFFEPLFNFGTDLYSKNIEIFDLIDFELLKYITIGIYIYAIIALVIPLFIGKVWQPKTIYAARFALIWTAGLFTTTYVVCFSKMKEVSPYFEKLVTLTDRAWYLLICLTVAMILSFTLNGKLSYCYWKETYGSAEDD